MASSPKASPARRGAPGHGQRYGRWTTGRLLGQGAVGRVFLAHDAAGREAVLTVVSASLARDPAFRTRLAREAEALTAVRGRRTAALVDADPQAAVPWLATEYVDGPTLAARVGASAGGPLGAPELRTLASALAEALSDLHRAGLAHGGLRPWNVLLTADGPRVTGMGVAGCVEGFAYAEGAACAEGVAYAEGAAYAGGVAYAEGAVQAEGVTYSEQTTHAGAAHTKGAASADGGSGGSTTGGGATAGSKSAGGANSGGAPASSATHADGATAGSKSAGGATAGSTTAGGATAGSAAHADGATAGGATASSAAHAEGAAHAGHVQQTGYVAPELLADPARDAYAASTVPAAPTPPADIYSLGAVLLFAATGRAPSHAGAQGPEDGVPRELVPLISACLAEHPAARPAPRTVARMAGLPLPGSRRRALTLAGTLLLAQLAAAVSPLGGRWAPRTVGR